MYNYNPTYPSKAHVVDTSTTSVNVNLSHDCRRIRLKAHTQDIFYGIGSAAQVAEGAPAAAVAVHTACLLYTKHMTHTPLRIHT